MIARIVAATVFLVASALPSRAQQALSVGTATALGDAAVVEARRADALRWNPALLGIYDGPLASYSFLAVDVAAVPARGWALPAQSLRLYGLPPALQWTGSLAPAAGGAVAAGGVQWISTQRREFALSVSTHHVASGAIPEEIGAVLGGSEASGTPVGPDSTVRASVSVVALGRGLHAGRVPMLGRMWLGATVTGWWAHTYARGNFLAAAPGEEVYREAVIRDVPGYGLDLGFASQPHPRVRVGASVSNVVSGALRPKQGPQVRRVSVVPAEDGNPLVTESHGPYLGEADEGTEDGRLGQALWESVAVPVVLRGGASAETDIGTFSGALRSTLLEGGLDPEWESTTYTIAYAGSAVLPLRASYGWGGETRVASIGLRVGPCERRWNFGITRRSGPWGSLYGATASVTVGSSSGCDLFRT